MAGDFDLTDSLTAHLQVYSHNDKGAGNNWIVGKSTQGTTATADDYPVQIRDTRYTIDRQGGLVSLAWHVGFNQIQAGLWLEDNKSSAVRYIWTNVTQDLFSHLSLSHFLSGTPSSARSGRRKPTGILRRPTCRTPSRCSTMRSASTSVSRAPTRGPMRGRSTASPRRRHRPPPSSPPASCARATSSCRRPVRAGSSPPDRKCSRAMPRTSPCTRGGFKLGPQSVSQAVWDVQGSTLKPETSKSFDGGYRYVTDSLQVSLAAYKVDFNNRLLQYNPCPTNQQQNPGLRQFLPPTPAA